MGAILCRLTGHQKANQAGDVADEANYEADGGEVVASGAEITYFDEGDEGLLDICGLNLGAPF
jgi:hypothetical protein